MISRKLFLKHQKTLDGVSISDTPLPDIHFLKTLDLKARDRSRGVLPMVRCAQRPKALDLKARVKQKDYSRQSMCSTPEGIGSEGTT